MRYDHREAAWEAGCPHRRSTGRLGARGLGTALLEMGRWGFHASTGVPARAGACSSSGGAAAATGSGSGGQKRRAEGECGVESDPTDKTVAFTSLRCVRPESDSNRHGASRDDSTGAHTGGRVRRRSDDSTTVTGDFRVTRVRCGAGPGAFLGGKVVRRELPPDCHKKVVLPPHACVGRS